jgi:hypothetical protein
MKDYSWLGPFNYFGGAGGGIKEETGYFKPQSGVDTYGF